MLDSPNYFWPFAGRDVPTEQTLVAEVYTSLWDRNFPRNERAADQHDAYSTAEWLRRTDRDGNLDEFIHPSLTVTERTPAEVEGRILSVRRWFVPTRKGC